MIKTRQVNGTLHITLSGRLAISTVYELTDILTHVADSCERYCLDMCHVTAVSDGGLSVLAMFARHARRLGYHVRLTGCDRALIQRLTAIPAMQGLLLARAATATVNASSGRGRDGHNANFRPRTLDPDSNHYADEAGIQQRNISWH